MESQDIEGQENTRLCQMGQIPEIKGKDHQTQKAGKKKKQTCIVLEKRGAATPEEWHSWRLSKSGQYVLPGVWKKGPRNTPPTIVLKP